MLVWYSLLNSIFVILSFLLYLLTSQLADMWLPDCLLFNGIPTREGWGICCSKKVRCFFIFYDHLILMSLEPLCNLVHLIFWLHKEAVYFSMGTLFWVIFFWLFEYVKSSNLSYDSQKTYIINSKHTIYCLGHSWWMSWNRNIFSMIEGRFMRYFVHI